MSEEALHQAASRFGEVAKIEIVKYKACAFLEFAKVESARRAIIASLTTQQGGEGGVKAGSGDGKLTFETRKEKDERRPKGQTRGPAPERGNGKSGPRLGGPGSGRDGPGSGPGAGPRDESALNAERTNGPNGAGAGKGPRGRSKGGPGGGGGGGGDRGPPQAAPTK